MTPRYVVLHHTAGPVDRTVDDIRDYHVRTLGWSDIGYHEVVHHDGTRHLGRPAHRAGAHTSGLNDSYGIVWVGNGLSAPPSPAAWVGLLEAAYAAMVRFALDPAHVIGHREAPAHGGKPTSKACPAVDMGAVRAALWARVGNPR
jgi:N-acetylmuramoyl-L-alanine amidase